MFAGVEVLNDCNYGSKGQVGEDLSVPEIQVDVKAVLIKVFAVN